MEAKPQCSGRRRDWPGWESRSTRAPVLWPTTISTELFASVVDDGYFDILDKTFGEVESAHAAVVMPLPFIVITLATLTVRHKFPPASRSHRRANLGLD